MPSDYKKNKECADKSAHSDLKCSLKFPGGYSRRATPVPIPNTEVKLATPKILGWRRPGKIGTARVCYKKPPSRFLGGFFAFVTIAFFILGCSIFSIG